MEEKRTETGIDMNTLLLVDGHNLLFRMFYGMPDHFRTPEGVRYNAVYGFANAMAAALSELRPARRQSRLPHSRSLLLPGRER